MEDSSASSADAMAIASAFRAANDEDTMQVMNTQSSKKEADLAKLYFYVVPSTWMRKAWPFLQNGQAAAAASSWPVVGRDWREEIGRIENQPLLVVSEGENAVSSDEEEAQQQQQQQSQMVIKRTTGAGGTGRREVALRRDLTHEQDFFLLGPNAWLLVKEKFGFDYEIEKPCVFDSQSSHNPLLVVLHVRETEANPALLVQHEFPAVHIPVPPTGRFQYEVCLQLEQNGNGNNNGNQLLNGPAHAHAGTTPPGNVSDDDTAPAYTDDLFPALDDDDRMSTDHDGSDLPLLVLPPSGGQDNHSSWLSDRNSIMDMDEGKTDTGSTILELQTPQIRPYGSGLGNLGNTCFMNSTLQCLAHTTPLQRYFLSGDYAGDLNRDNPLGTGGELATEFAGLLADMWGTASSSPSSSQRPGIFSSNSGYNSDALSNFSVVYPRNFKYTLGKHAEQFVGYDQHDSQELATYLLDALHEDTNRVTKKPYVEKPEQGVEETDEDAAKKAWQLHLQREDSKVLENFMGQVKSRVQCCEEGCGRVSTTFDPFMYLSVPIPGSSERTLQLTFVPLDPTSPAKTMSITLPKTSVVSELTRKVKAQLEKLGIIDERNPIALEDLCPVDVWQKEVYAWHGDKHEVDRIRENDETFVYQLRPLAEVKAAAAGISSEEEDDTTASIIGLRSTKRARRYQIDVGTLTRINRGNDWMDELLKYVQVKVVFVNAFHPKKGSTQNRVASHKRLVNFIELCQEEADAEVDTAGQKRTHPESSGAVMTSPEDEELPALVSRSDSSSFFKNVRTRYDVAILEFLAAKMRLNIIHLENVKKHAHPDGVRVQIRLQKSGTHSMAKEQALSVPLVLRIPSAMTVYGLRAEMARQLARSIKTGHSASHFDPPTSGQPTSENEAVPMQESASANAEQQSSVPNSFGSPELMVVRQIPLSYERKSGTTAYKNYSSSSGIQLGSVEKRARSNSDGDRTNSMALPSNEDEKCLVAELVGDEGTIFMDWPAELCDRSFDLTEYEKVEEAHRADSGEGVATRTRASKTTTVLECIEKFCAMEQLEETEMWYCNQCKQHVRAWKQFHVYRAPPILIVHLKRFQYSASTHRRDKLGVLIDFPLVGLDLTAQVLHWTGDERPIYDCYAVSNHYGGLGGGHYTAYALNDDGVWCHYDDSRVTTDIDPKEVVSQAAYVLYYRRRDVRVSPDFLASIQTSSSRLPASEVSSSNAAMIDEDDTMEVDVLESGSRSTSPMGSTGDAADAFVDLEFETEDASADDRAAALPRQ